MALSKHPPHQVEEAKEHSRKYTQAYWVCCALSVGTICEGSEGWQKSWSCERGLIYFCTFRNWNHPPLLVPYGNGLSRNEQPGLKDAVRNREHTSPSSLPEERGARVCVCKSGCQGKRWSEWSKSTGVTVTGPGIPRNPGSTLHASGRNDYMRTHPKLHS